MKTFMITFSAIALLTSLSAQATSAVSPKLICAVTKNLLGSVQTQTRTMKIKNGVATLEIGELMPETKVTAFYSASMPAPFAISVVDRTKTVSVEGAESVALTLAGQRFDDPGIAVRCNLQ
jgi:hypothetical protein